VTARAPKAAWKDRPFVESHRMRLSEEGEDTVGAGLPATG
jgi:hypothetical protein